LAKNTPISVQLTGANIHDSDPVKVMIYPLESLGIQRFVADKAYDNDKVRGALLDLSIKADIPL
jgi:hypothetical protein